MKGMEARREAVRILTELRLPLDAEPEQVWRAQEAARESHREIPRIAWNLGVHDWQEHREKLRRWTS